MDRAVRNASHLGNTPSRITRLIRLVDFCLGFDLSQLLKSQLSRPAGLLHLIRENQQFLSFNRKLFKGFQILGDILFRVGLLGFHVVFFFISSQVGRQNSRRPVPPKSQSRRDEFGKFPIALAGQSEIFFGESSGIVRGERERHLVKTNINVGMVIELLCPFGHAIDPRNALQKSLELKGPPNRAGALLPVGDGF